jgi:E3 ubiquitin-protein ligase RNF11
MGNCVCADADDENQLFEDDELNRARNTTPQHQSTTGASSVSSNATYSRAPMPPPDNVANESRRMRMQTRSENPLTGHHSRNYLYSEPRQQQLYFPSPGQRGLAASELNEEEQIRIAKRLGLLGQLPCIRFKETMRDKMTECTICMCEYVIDDQLRCLPCLHSYHKQCIDDWLVRSFTCPDCCEPVEPALMSTFHLS